MKKTILILLQLVIVQHCIFGQEIQATSKPSEVTVYRNQAKETRLTSINITEGNNDIVISGVSMMMIDQSLQVSVHGNSNLLSATVRTNYFSFENAPKNDAKSERLRDSIKTITIALRWINEEKSLQSGELNLLGELLRPDISKDGLKPADINAMADIYRVRYSELTKKIFDLSLKEESLQEKIALFENQLQEMGSKKTEPVKEIVLSFFSEKSESIQINCSYLVTSAGWAPMYDIHVENTSKPVDLTYKAKLYQQTGMDWKDVKITVSTANPSINNNRPLMSPKYMDYVTYRFTPSASSGVISNMMQAQRLDNNTIPKLESEVTLNPIDPEEKDILLEFVLENKQTIPSDGKEHVCKLQQLQIPATYKYHAVPKLDPAAFLLARITDYGKYNLLSGDANIFYGDTYIGKVGINPQVISDTLLISLGRDERIVVKRVRVGNKISKKIFSGVEIDTYEWETTIRNNKSTPIEIEILDQIPLTRRKEIVVNLSEKSGADYNKNYGKLLWNYTIKPNQSKKIQLKYTVEYPEGKSVEEQ